MTGDRAGDRGRYILCLNAGSSSLKFGVFDLGDPPTRIYAGVFDRIGGDSSLTYWAPEKRAEREKVALPNHTSCLEVLLERLPDWTGGLELAAVGHRIVHGHTRYLEPEMVTSEMMDNLRQLTSIAREHLPAEIALTEAIGDRFPAVPQVACFDTAFHRNLDGAARTIALPRHYQEKGVRRYGFHGLSYEYLLGELGRLGDSTVKKGRIILAHLGNGASMAAVREGTGIDTSMAFTPTAGLVMGTRSGDLDPGLVSFLALEEQMSPERFDKMVNHESGLLGVSEISSDMEELLRLEADDIRAAEAVSLFCYQAKKWIGAFAAALSGLDTLVFAGGIGENSPAIRARICAGLEFLGVELSEEENNENAAVISATAAPVTIRVIRTDEEMVIAKSAFKVLQAQEQKG